MGSSMSSAQSCGGSCLNNPSAGECVDDQMCDMFCFFLVCIFVIVCVSFFSLSLCTCMYYEQYMPLDFGLKVAHQHEGESQRGPSTLHE